MSTTELVRGELRQLIKELDDGARLPTVRDLMRRFSVSQSTVQAALHELREAGNLSSQVGRGTFVVKKEQGRNRESSPSGRADSSAGDLSSYLMLSSSRLSGRSIIVQNSMHTALSNQGIDVVQMSYQDVDQLVRLLDGAPNFEVAILQSQYEMVPIRLLNLLHQKSRAIVADGHSISGLDLDVVGTDWSEAMDDALEHLTELGHREIALVTIDSQAWPILAAQRYFARVQNWRGTGLRVHPTLVMQNVAYPSHPIVEPLKRVLREQRSDSGRLPFTALLCLGIADGAGIRQAIEELEIAVPTELSVYLLGHCDVPSEHNYLFTMSGPTTGETVTALTKSIKDRLKKPGEPPKIVHLPVHRKLRESTAEPGRR